MPLTNSNLGIMHPRNILSRRKTKTYTLAADSSCRWRTVKWVENLHGLIGIDSRPIAFHRQTDGSLRLHEMYANRSTFGSILDRIIYKSMGYNRECSCIVGNIGPTFACKPNTQLSGSRAKLADDSLHSAHTSSAERSLCSAKRLMRSQGSSGGRFAALSRQTCARLGVVRWQMPAR